MEQYDGSVVPSMFQATQPADAGAYRMNNLSLKEGIVTDIIYPDSKDSLFKGDIEYNVAVAEYAPGMGANLQLYRNCRIANIFGTTNNSINFTLQPSSDKVDDTIGGESGASVFKDGARVLLLCISGVAQAGNGVIISGLRHGADKIYNSKDGQFYDFNFNGIQQLINKDGEYIINFNSPVDQEGKKSNEKASGTQIKVDKEGRVTIKDNEGEVISVDRIAKKIEIKNGAESIIVDKGNKSIEIKSTGDIKEDASKNLDMKAGTDAKLDAGKQLQLKSGGQTKIEAGGTMEVKSGGQWRLQASSGVMIQSGGEISMISASGPLLRSAGPISQIGNGGVPAAGVGISQALGIGNLGAPVLSTIITGSSTTFIGS